MPGQNLGIYDPNKNFVNVQNRSIEGFGSDEMVRTERNDENEASAKMGVQGDGTFQVNQDKSGTIIITLKQLSPSHVFLQSLKEAQSLFAVAITSKHNHQQLVTATACMIKVAPRALFGKEEAEYVWVIEALELIETAKAL